MAAVSTFLDILARGPDPGEHVFNPWADHDERDAAPRKDMPGRRLENMGAYLEARTQSARVLLLGEAPSHRGCRFSGIPFCSEVELLHKRDLVARHALQLTSAVASVKPPANTPSPASSACSGGASKSKLQSSVARSVC